MTKGRENGPTIYVDVHEKDSEIIKELNWVRDEYTCPIIMKKMKTGDVVISFEGYLIGIEIKRKHDMEKSLYEGRLHSQLCRLYDEFDYPVLIIEEWEGHDIDQLQKTIDTLNLRIATFTRYSQKDTVDLISEFVRKLIEKKFHVLRRPIIVEHTLDPRISVLCSFENISKARAEILLERYATLDRALRNMDEWSSLKIGLTEQRVERIKGIMYNKFGG